MSKTIDIEQIANLIPKGHKNAINLQEVVRLFENHGIINDSDNKERRVRAMIERAGYEYTICNLQDGKGYFRPTKDDIVSFRKWIRQEEARLSKISKRLCTGRKVFEDFLKCRLDEQEIRRDGR